jgi:hypothetical protein
MGRELLSGGGALPVGQGPIEVGFDGGPVDVGDAAPDDVGQVGEQPVSVAAVAVDEVPQHAAASKGDSGRCRRKG